MTRRRVAVTGIGVVASCGIGAEAFWAGLHRPQTPGSDRSVLDFDPSLYFASPKESRRADPFQQYALAAAGEALDQSGALTADPARIGSLVATGIGGLRSLEEQVMVYNTKGPRRVSPFLVPMMMGNAGAASISMRYGFQGPCETTVTACAAGTHAIGNAADLIRWGRADAVITGGSEAANTPVGQAGFRNMTALSNSGVSRPFDVDRDGFVQAEAAGILVLEELGLARERGATILAEILGSANTADAYHITAPAPGGSGAIRCMEVALDDAGLTAADIVYINAHGTSTPLNDASEAEALAKVFGTPGPPVTSTKGVTGHALGAAGAIEAVAVVLSMQHRQIPPTDGHVTMDPELPPINLVVGDPLEWEPGPSLSNSFGFGGHNGTLVIGPPPTD
jgi:3-oxoacyl-[acyl-carrier-protein] synthase II